MLDIRYLDATHPEFPSTEFALEEPNGLLAVGGNLQPSTLLTAYSLGIFPWFDENQPYLWWSPSPRMTLAPKQAHYSKSLRKLARKKPFRISCDQAFESVMRNCSKIERPGQDGTWIDEEMIAAYCNLHELGYAHSIEAWHNDTLVGGLYGIALGKIFYGESMFSFSSGASKIAFASLCQQLQHWDFQLIDCQIYTDYLASFGAREIERSEFESIISQSVDGEHSRFSDTMGVINIPKGERWKEIWCLPEHGFDQSI